MLHRFAFACAFALAACSNSPATQPLGAGDMTPTTSTDDSGTTTDDAAPSVDLAALPDLATPDLVPVPPPPDLASPCGSCPTGYTCGAANGAPVCKSASGVPLFTHVYVVMMENTSWSTLDGSTNTPFLHGLEKTAAFSTNYHGVTHPSLPNYVALTSGDPQGISCDCNPTGSACNSVTCSSFGGFCGCPQSAMHIGDALDAAKIQWRAYGEDMGQACNTTTSGEYAARHVPFLYYDDMQNDMTRCQSRVVDLQRFATDNPTGMYAFNFIAPNLIHDMHDPFPATSTNLANGDAWLSQFIPTVTSSTAYKSGGLIVIVWDEDDLSGGLFGSDDPVPMYVLSPYGKTGYSSSTHFDHYSLLATIAEGMNIAKLGNAASATTMAEMFAAQ